MRNAIGRKLTLFGALAGTAALLLAGGPALASGTHPTISRGHITTGPEVVYGTVYGKAAITGGPMIPVRLAGVVTAVGSVNLGGPPRGKHHLTSSAGRLDVQTTAKPQNKTTFNPANCHFTFTTAIPLAITGGTGTFAGASGPAAVEVNFGAYAHRYTSGPHKGQCNPHSQPYAQGAVANFLLTATLTIK